MLGAFLSAGSSILGSVLGARSAENAKDANVANAIADRELQKEFAQNGIRWKVEDAIAAGLHPMAALGAQVSSYSPSPLNIMPDNSLGEGLSRAGQDIGRAIEATRTNEERQVGKLASLSVERAELENDLLRSQIARNNSGQIGPPLPTNNDPYLIGGQAQSGPSAPGVMMQPSKITASQPGQIGKEAGVVTDYSYARTASGGLAPVASKDIKERIEDAIIPEMSHALRNNITPNLPWNWGSHATKPPLSALPEGANDWTWSMKEQAWMPGYYRPMPRYQPRFDYSRK